jgi:hypothetical protein
MAALTEHPGQKDLLVTHRTSWGILPQTPVFSLRSVKLCDLNHQLSYTYVTERNEPRGSGDVLQKAPSPGPKCRAKPENRGRGEDPPGTTMTSNLRESFPQPFCSMVHQPSRGQRAERSEPGGLGEDPPGSTMTSKLPLEQRNFCRIKSGQVTTKFLNDMIELLSVDFVVQIEGCMDRGTKK